MALYTARPIANGLGTDHPIPDLPFVDDTDLPTDPREIEAVGRNRGEGMWGREDNLREHGWVAYTTVPERTELGWFVRFHPDHGRTVMLVHNKDASLQHTIHAFRLPEALLFRAGGYWWDGSSWYRPAQNWDRPAEKLIRRPAPGAVSVTAADVLAAGGDPARGRFWTVEEFDPEERPKQWQDDLALWAKHRLGDRPLSKCVVRVAAPELTGDQLIGVAEMAQTAGIAASTLRAYIVRGEADVPEPQAVISGRNVWSRPVASDWADERKRSPESVIKAVSVEREGSSMPVGVSDLWSRFSGSFFANLWGNVGLRKRWALRWRTEEHVRQVAEELGWTVAAGLDNIVPIGNLSSTIRQAVLDEISQGVALQDELRRKDEPRTPLPEYDINFEVASMLGWLVRHEPAVAQGVIGDIIGEAERRLELPRRVLRDTMLTALRMYSGLEGEVLKTYVDRALPAE